MLVIVGMILWTKSLEIVEEGFIASHEYQGTLAYSGRKNPLVGLRPRSHDLAAGLALAKTSSSVALAGSTTKLKRASRWTSSGVGASSTGRGGSGAFVLGRKLGPQASRSSIGGGGLSPGSHVSEYKSHTAKRSELTPLRARTALRLAALAWFVARLARFELAGLRWSQRGRSKPRVA